MVKQPRRTCIHCHRAGRRDYQLVPGPAGYYECAAIKACVRRVLRLARQKGDRNGTRS
jgi:hypothetical protein